MPETIRTKPDWLFWVAGSTVVITTFGVVCTFMCIS